MRRSVAVPALAQGALLAWLSGMPASAADVAVLAQELGAPNVVVRRDAAFALDAMGAGAKAALPALIRALDDADRQVWSFSISAIAHLGPDAQEAIPALIDGLGNRKSRGRDRDRRQAVTRAAFALSRIGVAALPALMDAAKSDDASLRAGAAKALAGMGREAAPAIPFLIANLNGDEEVRRETTEALGAIGEAAVKPLAEALKSKEAPQRAGAATSLGLIGVAAKECAAAFAEAAKSESDPQARVAMLGALPRIGLATEEVVPLLVAGVKDDNEQVRHAAINALVPMRAGREVVLTALEQALRDENAATRQRAARALGRMGPAASPAVPALIDAARKSPADTALATALSEIGPAALPPVLAALHDAPPAEAERIVGLLRGFGSAAVPVLMEALKNPTVPVRVAAARALGGMGREAAPAIELLFGLAANAEPPARGAALRALVVLEGDAQRLKPMLETALHDAAPEVRRAGAAGMARFGGTNALGVAGLVELLDDESAATRLSAIDQIGNLGPGAAPALPAMMERLNDPDLQAPLLAALAKMGPASIGALPRLTELAKAPAIPTRVAAVLAISGIGHEAAAALPTLYAVAKDEDGDVRAAAIKALAAVEPNEAQTITTLVKALEDESGRVRRPAAAALSKFGDRARVATPALVAMLDRDTDRGVALLALKVIGVRSVTELLPILSARDSQVRIFACEQLASIGPDAKDAVPRLKELAASQPQSVQEAARSALAKIAPAP